MARSEYIYVVTHPRQSYPLATFTVKHELRSWLIKLVASEPHYLPLLSIYRFNDGPGGRIAEMYVQSVIEGRSSDRIVYDDNRANPKR